MSRRDGPVRFEQLRARREASVENHLLDCGSRRARPSARSERSFISEGPESGFTLIELIISLALFALLSLAGIALVDGVLNIERRTNGRLDRLADLQRAMFVIGGDLEQVAGGPIAGGGSTLSFTRPVAAAGGLGVAMRYSLGPEGVTRDVAVPGGMSGTQALLPGAVALRFRFWTKADGWVERWPPAEDRAAEWPQAIEVDMALPGGGQGMAGTLRRLVALPERPR